MAVKVCQTKCCGLRELEDLGTVGEPEQVMEQLRSQFLLQGQLRDIAFILFTGVTSRYREDHTGVTRPDDYGGALAAFISEERLGTVTTSGERRNPKTNNGLTCWLWSPNHAGVQKWYQEHPATTPEVRIVPNAAGSLVGDLARLMQDIHGPALQDYFLDPNTFIQYLGQPRTTARIDNIGTGQLPLPTFTDNTGNGQPNG